MRDLERLAEILEKMSQDYYQSYCLSEDDDDSRDYLVKRQVLSDVVEAILRVVRDEI